MNVVLLILRGAFILLLAAVGWHYVVDPSRILGTQTWLALALALVIAAFAVSIDILAPRKKLTLFAGTFLGLVVGVAMAYALSFVVQLLVQQFVPLETTTPDGLPMTKDQKADAQLAQNNLQSYLTLVVGCATTYLSISVILQTKDDFRFIIPYVEFRKQVRGNRPLVLDTSVLIDGRIAAIMATGILESQLTVPRFVLLELQAVADSPDRLKRNRGRRGLDVLAKLQNNEKADVSIYDPHSSRDENQPVDQRLITLSKEMEARLVTTDYNLNKVAQLAGVDVLNINELAANLKPEVLPGEKMRVKLIKPGESPGQGIGYLDDGTMVVVEQGRAHLNEDVEFTVNNTMQTNAGKMIFGRLGDGPARPERNKPQPAAS